MDRINKAIKCVVIGDGMVGKTCLAYSYAHNVYPGNNIPSVYDIHPASVPVNDKLVTVDMYDTLDTLGVTSYKHRLLIYPETDVLLVCFSLTNPTSFQNVRDKWFPEINRFCPNVPIILVGNKLDLAEDNEALDEQNLGPVTISDGLSLAIEMNVVKYVECSCRTLEGLKEVFDEAFRTVINTLTTKPVVSPSTDTCVLS